MEIRFNVTGAARKELVEAIGGIIGWTPLYMRAPSFAYIVNNYTIDKEGTLFCDDRADSGEVQRLLVGLVAKGFDYEGVVGEDIFDHDASTEASLPDDADPVCEILAAEIDAPTVNTRDGGNSSGEDAPADAPPTVW